LPATDKLIAGYKRFRDGYYHKNKDKLLTMAKEGQSPKIAIVSCCDSRVEPSIIMDCEPGDLFVIRNVANLVPPCESDDSYHGTSAALEFAVNALAVESIIILGHSHCGGIKALMDKPDSITPNSFIYTWMKQLNNLRTDILADEKMIEPAQQYKACEKQGISQSLNNLLSFPWIKSAVDSGALKLHGAYYELNSARLFVLEQETGKFQKVI